MVKNCHRDEAPLLSARFPNPYIARVGYVLSRHQNSLEKSMRFRWPTRTAVQWLRDVVSSGISNSKFRRSKTKRLNFSAIQYSVHLPVQTTSRKCIVPQLNTPDFTTPTFELRSNAFPFDGGTCLLLGVPLRGGNARISTLRREKRWFATFSPAATRGTNHAAEPRICCWREGSESPLLSPKC